MYEELEVEAPVLDFEWSLLSGLKVQSLICSHRFGKGHCLKMWKTVCNIAEQINQYFFLYQV